MEAAITLETTCNRCGKSHVLTPLAARHRVRICRECKRLSEVGRSKRRNADGTRSEYMAAWRKRNRERMNAHTRRYQADPSNRDKNRARWAVRRAVKRGAIVRPSACEKCGAHGPIEAHHWKGYAPEFRLDVQWLCIPCHKRAHNANT